MFKTRTLRSKLLTLLLAMVSPLLALVGATAAVAAVLPVVTGLSPAVGKTSGGMVVTITGTGLTGASKVLFGTKAGTKLKVTSDSQLQVTAPSGSGTVDVKVTTPTGSSGAAEAARFRYVAVPTVSKVSPTTGSTNGGTKVTLTGTNFVNVTKVTFGSSTAKDLTVTSEKSLTVTAPKHATGRVDVRVHTAFGTSPTTSKDRYTYLAPPSVSKVSPSKGKLDAGTKVTISGSRFTKITKVMFGDVAGTSVKVSSSSKLTVTAPAHTAGTVAVAIIGTNGTSPASSKARYTYIAPPAITKLSPTTGTVKGGTKVTLTGSNFTGVTKVTFGTKTGTKLAVKSATSLTVTSPAQTSRTIDVKVTTKYGTSPNTTNTRYTYGTSPSAAPTITTVTPTTGSTDGGTKITITGTNLTGTTKVTLDGTPTTNLTVISPTQVTATTPTHTAGAVDLTLTTAGGTVTKTAAYTYITDACTPTVRHVSGTLTGDTTLGGDLCTSAYIVDGTLYVPVGTRLFVKPGAVIKFNGNLGYPAAVSVAGSLDVQGTTEDPVIFTSTTDDTAAGDTNIDGPSSGSVVYGTAIAFVDGAQISVTHADIRYFYYPMRSLRQGSTSAESGHVSLTKSRFSGYPGQTEINGETSGYHGSVTFSDNRIESGFVMLKYIDDYEMLRNTFTDGVVGTPLRLSHGSVKGLSLTGTNANSFAGTPAQRTISLSGYLSEGEMWTLASPPGGAISSDGLTISPGAKLAIRSGTVVKFAGSLSNYPSAFYVAGSLDIQGTTDRPVVFTSPGDDTAAGDTNSDGPSSGSVVYGTGIRFRAGAEVTIDHAEVRNFYYPVQSVQTGFADMSDEHTGSINIKHTTFSGAGTHEIYINGETMAGYHGNVIFNDNRIEAGRVTLRYIYQWEVMRNTFTEGVGSTPLTIYRGGSVLGIALDGPNANSFAGSASQRTVELSGYVPAGSKWILASPASGALVTDSLSIEDGAKVTAEQGTVIKFYDGWGSRYLSVAGSLVVEGTPENPVILTSIADDSAGGDTNNDGAARQPNAADWSGVSVTKSGSIAADFLNLRYSSTAVTTSGKLELQSGRIDDSSLGIMQTDGASSIDIQAITYGPILSVTRGAAEIRGKYLGATNAAVVTACNWQSSQVCAIDAAYFDWGTTQNPADAKLVCGAVSYSPWVGMDPADRVALWSAPNCDGSTYAPDRDVSIAAAQASTQVTGWQALCGVKGYESACDVARTYNACLGAAQQLARDNIAVSFPGAAVTPGEYLGIETVQNLGDIMQQSAKTGVQGAGKALSYGTQIASLGGIYLSLINSYKSCAPGVPPR